MQQVAQAWLVLTLTHDPLWLGVVAAAQFIPVLIFGLFAGVLADTLPSARRCIATQAVKMGLSIDPGGPRRRPGNASIPLLILLALIIGTVNAVDMPVRQAFAVEMVGREDIGNAVALNSAMFNGARVVGPAVAGLTIGAVGVAAAFVDRCRQLPGGDRRAARDARDASSTRRGSIARPTSFGGVMAQLREGLHYVRVTPLVLIAVLVVGLVSTFGMNFSVIIPPYAQDVLHSDAAGYGFLMAASGVGSLIGRAVARVRWRAARPADRVRRDRSSASARSPSGCRRSSRSRCC